MKIKYLSMRKASKKFIFSIVIGICLILTACQSVEKVGENNEEPNIKEEVAVTEDNVIELAEKEETELNDKEENKLEQDKAEPDQLDKLEEPEATEPTEPTKSTESTDLDETALDDNNKALPASYRDLTLDLYYNCNLLGFGDLSEITMRSDTDMSYNKFALADVDVDGHDELIVYFLTTAVAGHIGAIYDYNDETGVCNLKFIGYPLLSFYENGTLEEGWSHNQGYAGDFWPYTLHEYDKENDRYNTVNYVDAYDKSVYEGNQEALSDNPFPYDIDIDGNGFVYYIYSYENGLYDYQEIQAVDDGAYQTWLQEYTEGSKKIEITFYSITEENIDLIFDK